MNYEIMQILGNLSVVLIYILIFMKYYTYHLRNRK